ncbi:MAG: hypothetical protein Kow0069_15620 [Promethearchaeota archaeon]
MIDAGAQGKQQERPAVTVVLPAFNEEKRLPKFLKRLVDAYAHDNYEILVVDDGSTDDTARVARRCGARVVRYERNQGKGVAVRLGTWKARGSKIVFVDSDGAVPCSEVSRVVEVLERSDFVVGVRKRGVARSPVRRLLNRAFTLLVNASFGLRIKDPTCGCKGIRKDAVETVFGEFYLRRWAFDVELIYRAVKGGLRSRQLQVEWHEKGDSKLTRSTPFRMLLEVAYLRVRSILDRFRHSPVSRNGTEPERCCHQEDSPDAHNVGDQRPQ